VCLPYPLHTAVGNAGRVYARKKDRGIYSTWLVSDDNLLGNVDPSFYVSDRGLDWRMAGIPSHGFFPLEFEVIGSTPAAAVPAPVVGAGLPGLVMACGGLIAGGGVVRKPPDLFERGFRWRRKWIKGMRQLKI
jgi:hypothetical protein